MQWLIKCPCTCINGSGWLLHPVSSDTLHGVRRISLVHTLLPYSARTPREVQRTHSYPNSRDTRISEPLRQHGFEVLPLRAKRPRLLFISQPALACCGRSGRSGRSGQRKFLGYGGSPANATKSQRERRVGWAAKSRSSHKCCIDPPKSRLEATRCG